MKKYNINFSDRTIEALRRYADAHDIPLTEAHRRILDAALGLDIQTISDVTDDQAATQEERLQKARQNIARLNIESTKQAFRIVELQAANHAIEQELTEALETVQAMTIVHEHQKRRQEYLETQFSLFAGDVLRRLSALEGGQVAPDDLDEARANGERFIEQLEKALAEFQARSFE